MVSLGLPKLRVHADAEECNWFVVRSCLLRLVEGVVFEMRSLVCRSSEEGASVNLLGVFRPSLGGKYFDSWHIWILLVSSWVYPHDPPHP